MIYFPIIYILCTNFTLSHSRFSKWKKIKRWYCHSIVLFYVAKYYVTHFFSRARSMPPPSCKWWNRCQKIEFQQYRHTHKSIQYFIKNDINIAEWYRAIDVRFSILSFCRIVSLLCVSVCEKAIKNALYPVYIYWCSQCVDPPKN